ncbi:MAG TPA: hypothetical protein VGZ29_05630 [Terriglobia bacterium]|nr:hypothetical protein [Terriglobia bacterium]
MIVAEWRKGTRVRSQAFGEGVVEAVRGQILGIRFLRGSGFVTLNAEIHPLEVLGKQAAGQLTAEKPEMEEKKMPRGTPLQVDIDKLRSLAAQGMNSVQIAERLGVSRPQVNMIANRNGISLTPAPRGRRAASGKPGKAVTAPPRKPRAVREGSSLGTKGDGRAPIPDGHPYAAVIAGLEARGARMLEAARLLRGI